MQGKRQPTAISQTALLRCRRPRKTQPLFSTAPARACNHPPRTRVRDGGRLLVRSLTQAILLRTISPRCLESLLHPPPPEAAVIRIEGIHGLASGHRYYVAHLRPWASLCWQPRRHTGRQAQGPTRGEARRTGRAAAAWARSLAGKLVQCPIQILLLAAVRADRTETNLMLTQEVSCDHGHNRRHCSFL